MGGSLVEALLALAMIATVPAILAAVAASVWLIARRRKSLSGPTSAPATDAARPNDS